MKTKPLLYIGSLAILALFSCKKKYTCTCTVTENDGVAITEYEVTYEAKYSNKDYAKSACDAKQSNYNLNAGTSALCLVKKGG